MSASATQGDHNKQQQRKSCRALKIKYRETVGRYPDRLADGKMASVLWGLLTRPQLSVHVHPPSDAIAPSRTASGFDGGPCQRPDDFLSRKRHLQSTEGSVRLS